MRERPGFRGAFILRGRSLFKRRERRRRLGRSSRACRLGHRHCRLISLGELRPRPRQWRAGRRRGRDGALRRPARRHPVGAGPSRVWAVAVRSHDDPSRRTHDGHAVARHRHRHDPHDAPHLSIDDDSNLLAAGIERARHVEGTLAQRTAQGLEPGRTHDCRNLLRRQRSAVVGSGIVTRRNRLRGNASRTDRGKGEGGGADCDLSFQVWTPRCDLNCAPPRPPFRGAKTQPDRHCADARERASAWASTIAGNGA